MQQGDITFPITIIMKNGELQVISTVPSTETQPLLRRVLEELDVSTKDRSSDLEYPEEPDGRPNTFFQTVEGMQADALCLLSSEDDVIFMLIEEVNADEAEHLRQQMREKLIEYIRSLPK